MREKVADAMLEIGTEELPARFLPMAQRQIQELAGRLLKEAALPCTRVTAQATPRRLVLLLKGVPRMQKTREVVVLGPLSTQAFDAAGKPTQAAEGFARKHGVPVSALETRPGDRGDRLAYVGKETGKPAAEVLARVFAQVIEKLEFPKTMRWPQSPVSFARPIRWLVALWGNRPLKLSAGGVKSQPVTRGRRFVHPKPLAVKSVSQYLSVLRRAGILVEARAAGGDPAGSQPSGRQGGGGGALGRSVAGRGGQPG